MSKSLWLRFRKRCGTQRLPQCAGRIPVAAALDRLPAASPPAPGVVFPNGSSSGTVGAGQTVSPLTKTPPAILRPLSAEAKSCTQPACPAGAGPCHLPDPSPCPVPAYLLRKHQPSRCSPGAPRWHPPCRRAFAPGLRASATSLVRPSLSPSLKLKAPNLNILCLAFRPAFPPRLHLTAYILPLNFMFYLSHLGSKFHLSPRSQTHRQAVPRSSLRALEG